MVLLPLLSLKPSKCWRLFPEHASHDLLEGEQRILDIFVLLLPPHLTKGLAGAQKTNQGKTPNVLSQTAGPLREGHQ